MRYNCGVNMTFSLRVATAAVGIAAAAVACSKPASQGAAETSAAPPPPPPTAQSSAEAIKGAVPQITRLIPLTEDNDSNNLLGRPGGYTAAVVLVDPRSTGVCDLAKPGADCGATVEQWPDHDAAQKRADYIKQIRGAAPVLGTEWTIVKDNLVLRVTGDLTPSVEKAYEAAFKG